MRRPKSDGEIVSVEAWGIAAPAGGEGQLERVASQLAFFKNWSRIWIVLSTMDNGSSQGMMGSGVFFEVSFRAGIAASASAGWFLAVEV